MEESNKFMSMSESSDSEEPSQKEADSFLNSEDKEHFSPTTAPIWSDEIFGATSTPHNNSTPASASDLAGTIVPSGRNSVGQNSGSQSLPIRADNGDRNIRRYSISLQDNTVVEITSSDSDEFHMECLCDTGACLAHPKREREAEKEIGAGVRGQRRLSRQKSFPEDSSSPADGSGGQKEEFDTKIVDMSHCHSNLSTTADTSARKKLIIASVLCLVFMIGEGVGGYLANSLAIATDAAHLLTDFASFLVSLFSLWMANRPATKLMSFGYYRAEVLGALTSVLMIWVVTGVLVYIAAERIVSKNFEIDATVMLITSGVGVAVNILMGLTLHQHGHTHGPRREEPPVIQADDTSPLLSKPHGTCGTKHSGHSIVVSAAFIHVVGDFLQSIGVFIAALVIYFKPTWGIVDPICTFLFSALVLITTITIMRDTMQVLMEGMPRGVDFNEVLSTFRNIKGVQQVHNLRIWALSMNKCAVSAHLAVDPDCSSQDILSEATRLARSKFNFFEMALQIEHFRPHMDDCQQCRSPNC